MGYKSPIHPLDLPQFRGETDEDSLVVKVVSPSVREGGDINAGRRTHFVDGEEVTETSDQYLRRVMGYLAPKIRFWNLEDEDGRAIPLPRDLTWVEVIDQDERLDRMVDHLFEQDENVILAIYHEWRFVGMPVKAETDEGKDSGTPSTPGPAASANNNGSTVDLRALELQIPQ
jgi:hypothetical protein